MLHRFRSLRTPVMASLMALLFLGCATVPRNTPHTPEWFEQIGETPDMDCSSCHEPREVTRKVPDWDRIALLGITAGAATYFIIAAAD